jgi:hypothetical protein
VRVRLPCDGVVFDVLVHGHGSNEEDLRIIGICRKKFKRHAEGGGTLVPVLELLPDRTVRIGARRSKELMDEGNKGIDIREGRRCRIGKTLRTATLE